MGALYLVASPIGNLADMSPRALETLRSVSLIACEDTRTSRKLLSYYDIHAQLVSCHAHNEDSVFMKKILPLLKKGESVAYLSEAGTPGISDPGNVVVERAYEHGVTAVPVSGPSAVTAVMSVAGLHGKGFVFEGFLPRKKGARRKILEFTLQGEKACIFFESQHRIVKFLEEVAEIDSSRRILIARELSKIYEECFRDKAEALVEQYKSGKRSLKGEFVLLVYPLKK